MSTLWSCCFREQKRLSLLLAYYHSLGKEPDQKWDPAVKQGTENEASLEVQGQAFVLFWNSSPWAVAGVCVNSAQSSPCSCLYFHCMDFSLEKAHCLFLRHVYNEMLNSSTGFGGDSKMINCGFMSVSYLFLCPKERMWRIPLTHFLMCYINM